MGITVYYTETMLSELGGVCLILDFQVLCGVLTVQTAYIRFGLRANYTFIKWPIYVLCAEIFLGRDTCHGYLLFPRRSRPHNSRQIHRLAIT